MKKKLIKKIASIRGQATIELAFSLPFLIWLIAYTFNAYYMIHTSHIAQKYAAMHLYKRLNHRAQFVMDDVEQRLHNRTFMGVQYVDRDTRQPPNRRIIFSSQPMNNIFGLCREPVCGP